MTHGFPSSTTAALFFSTYEVSKRVLGDRVFKGEKYESLVHMSAASFGEMAGCLIRVPTENVKQRMQTGRFTTMQSTLQDIIKTQGPQGLYRGYWSLLAREIPFSLIQFPIWEGLKKSWGKHQGEPVSPLQGALCGSVAGAIAASTTTPLDVIKTRLMLGHVRIWR